MQAIGSNQEAWLQDLESGLHPQAKEMLSCSTGYCCLGRGCIVMGLVPVRKVDNEDDTYWYEIFDGDDEKAPRSLINWLGLYDDVGLIDRNCDEGPAVGLGKSDCLTNANDNGWSFEQIAAFCRAYPNAVFREPR